MDLALKGETGVRPSKETRDGVLKNLRCLRDGSNVSADWIQSLGLEGRIYVANMGSADTPLTWDNTAYDADQPDHVVDVPDSVIAIPLYMQVKVIASGAAIFRGAMMASPLTVLDLSACAYTKVTPQSTRIGNTRVSACKAALGVTVNGNDPTANARWLSFYGNQGDLDATAIDASYEWSIQKCGFPVLIEDGGSWVNYVYNATSGTGFCIMVWAEIDKEEFRL